MRGRRNALKNQSLIIEFFCSTEVGLLVSMLLRGEKGERCATLNDQFTVRSPSLSIFG
jgi:hypothetical protein